MALVYKITNRITGKSYIGYTTNTLLERLDQHFKLALKEQTTTRKFYNAIQKYGVECWDYSVLRDNIDATEAKQVEIDMITLYDTYYKGYNSTKGGDGNNGIIMSEESNRKRSIALKGKSKDYDRMLGKTQSAETKQKISEAHKGMAKPWVKWSDEQIKKRAMTRRALTKEQHDDILRLRSEGLTITQVAEMLDVSCDIVKKWARRKW